MFETKENPIIGKKRAKFVLQEDRIATCSELINSLFADWNQNINPFYVSGQKRLDFRALLWLRIRITTIQSSGFVERV